jgi:hypothetical protein
MRRHQAALLRRHRHVGDHGIGFRRALAALED